MNPAYDSYHYPYVGPYLEQQHWYFIWNNVRFGPYLSQDEACHNFASLQDCGEADSCSKVFRYE